MWEKYSKNRLITTHKDWFFILKGIDSEKSIPFFCPKCHKPMNKIDDCYSFKKNFCCGVCERVESKNIIDLWRENYNYR